MKKILIIPILISLSLLNSSYRNKLNKDQDLKGIVCGSQNFISLLEREVDLNKIAENNYELLWNFYDEFDPNNGQDDWYMWWHIFDSNTGKLFEIDFENENLGIIKPLIEEKYVDGNEEDATDVFKSEIHKDFLRITTYIYVNDEYDSHMDSIYYFSDLTVTYKYSEKSFIDRCLYYPLPDDVKFY